MPSMRVDARSWREPSEGSRTTSGPPRPSLTVWFNRPRSRLTAFPPARRGSPNRDITERLPLRPRTGNVVTCRRLGTSRAGGDDSWSSSQCDASALVLKASLACTATSRAARCRPAAMTAHTWAPLSHPACRMRLCTGSAAPRPRSAPHATRFARAATRAGPASTAGTSPTASASTAMEPAAAPTPKRSSTTATTAPPAAARPSREPSPRTASAGSARSGSQSWGSRRSGGGGSAALGTTRD